MVKSQKERDKAIGALKRKRNEDQSGSSPSLDLVASQWSLGKSKSKQS